MKLAVAFITYNETSAGYLSDFLPSLERALQFLDPDDYRVYAFDNSDPAEERNNLLLESFNAGLLTGLLPRRPITVMTLRRNLGFSRAYNILIDRALADQAEYFFVINPDTLLEPETISRLLLALEERASLASVSPKILRWDFDAGRKTKIIDSLGLVLEPGLRFIDLGQGLPDEGQFNDLPILGPSGAAGLFRINALEKIVEYRGGNKSRQYFDERFFMYKEDCDLAYRLFLAGYESALVADALVYHDRTAVSSGRGLVRILQDRRGKSRQIRAWSFKNQHLLFVKHWTEQNIYNKAKIIYRVLTMFIFSLILEQFLLKEYCQIWRETRVLTNIK